MKAFEQFAIECEMDMDIRNEIKQFISNNYIDVLFKVDIEQMIHDLPSWIKEDVLVNQYGFLIKHFEFFTDIQEPSAWWGIVQKLVKITYEKGEKLYVDGAISDQVFFIHKGVVKLYGDFGYPFASFKTGQTVGENDVMTNIKRNGTAICVDSCFLYKIFKNQMEEALKLYPSVKKRLC